MEESDPGNGRWRLERKLDDGRVVTAYVVTGNYTDAAKYAQKPPQFLAALVHSYDHPITMAGAIESGDDFSQTVIQFGSCNSLSEVISYYNAGLRGHYLFFSPFG